MPRYAELRAKLAALEGLDDEIVVAPAAAAFDLAHAAEALAAAGAADPAVGDQLPSLLVAQHQQVAAARGGDERLVQRERSSAPRARRRRR